MKKSFYRALILSIIGILTTGAAMTAKAQQSIELSDAVVVVATVVSVDRGDRLVTLRTPDGSFHTLEVDHSERNFDQVEIGDKVKVKSYESVALYLGQPGEKPDARANLAVVRSVKGGKPGGVAVETVDITATVQKIDRLNRRVTLKAPHGKLVYLKVDGSIRGFDNLKEGDSIHVRHTEAIALSVEKQ